jgi:hypothetical protein
MYNPFEYFEYYKVYERIYQILQAELHASDTPETRRQQITAELQLLTASMQSICDAIAGYVPKFPPPKYSPLKQADDRTFLHCRYILGLTMEQTAEQMHISRDTAYRIRRRIAQTYRPYGSLPRL